MIIAAEQHDRRHGPWRGQRDLGKHLRRHLLRQRSRATSSRATRSAPTSQAASRCRTRRRGVSTTRIDNTIGGTAPGAGNLISGNSAAGIDVASPLSSGNVIVGNKIGIDIAGSHALPNSQFGVEIDRRGEQQHGRRPDGNARYRRRQRHLGQRIGRSLLLRYDGQRRCRQPDRHRFHRHRRAVRILRSLSRYRYHRVERGRTANPEGFLCFPLPL